MVLIEDVASYYSSTQFLGAIINSIADPVFVKDDALRLIIVNDAYCRFMGKKSEELLGKTDYDFYPMKQADSFKASEEKVINTSIPDIAEELIPNSEGHIMHVSVKKSLFVDTNQNKVLVGVIKDITDIRKAHENLVELSDGLRKKNEEMKRLMNSVTLDFKEPMQVLGRFLNCVEAQSKGQLTKDSKEYLAAAIGTVQQMKDTVDEMLNGMMAHHASGEGLAEVDMEEAIEIAKNNLQVSIRESGTRISIDMLVNPVGYKYQIVSLIQQLLSNAIEYKKVGVSPEIKIGTIAQNGRLVYFVKDNGKGMKPENHALVSKILKFGTAQAKTNTTTGLGNCHKIVDTHSGQIWMESNYGEGTSVYFTLGTNILADLQEQAN